MAALPPVPSPPLPPVTGHDPVPPVPGPYVPTLSELGAPQAAQQSVRDLDLLGRALRSMARNVAREGRRLPPINVARVTPAHTVELHLIAPSPPVAPFRAAHASTVWWCTPDAPGLLGPEAAAVVPSPYPALVSLGETADGATVLVDLEAIRLLHVSGEPHDIARVLRTLALELTFTPLADRVGVHVVGVAQELAAVADDRLVVHPDLEHAVAALQRRDAAVRSALVQAGAATPREARSRGLSGDEWAPEVVLCAGYPTGDLPEALGRLLDARPRGSVAVITAAPPQGTGPVARWTLPASGHGVVPGLEMDIQLQRLDDDTYHHWLRLLGADLVQPSVSAEPPPAPWGQAGPHPDAGRLSSSRFPEPGEWPPAPVVGRVPAEEPLRGSFGLPQAPQQSTPTGGTRQTGETGPSRFPVPGSPPVVRRTPGEAPELTSRFLPDSASPAPRTGAERQSAADRFPAPRGRAALPDSGGGELPRSTFGAPGPQSVNPQSVNPQSVGPQSVNQQSVSGPVPGSAGPGASSVPQPDPRPHRPGSERPGSQRPASAQAFPQADRLGTPSSKRFPEPGTTPSFPPGPRHAPGTAGASAPEARDVPPTASGYPAAGGSLVRGGFAPEAGVPPMPSLPHVAGQHLEGGLGYVADPGHVSGPGFGGHGPAVAGADLSGAVPPADPRVLVQLVQPVQASVVPPTDPWILALLGTPPAGVEPGEAQVRVLGPVELVGAMGPVEAAWRAGLLEVAARRELGPAQGAYVSADAIGRLREWLGDGPGGRPVNLRCDWDDFQALRARGLADPGANGDVALARALALVRGAPFAEAAYPWAEPLRAGMTDAVVDVAHELTLRRLRARDHQGAEAAARRGLVAEPDAELLLRDLVLVHADSGDGPQLQRTVARLETKAARTGLPPEPETAALLDELRSAEIDPLSRR